MSAFDAAVASLFADPNLASDATFVPQAGASAPVRVLVSAPDAYQKVGSSIIDTPTTMLEVLVSDCPSLSPGDRFLIGTTTYTVQGEPRRDAQQLTWQADVYAS